MIGDRIIKLEKFFRVKKPKELNYIEWGEKLHEMTIEWEGEHQEEFPI